MWVLALSRRTTNSCHDVHLCNSSCESSWPWSIELASSRRVVWGSALLASFAVDAFRDSSFSQGGSCVFGMAVASESVRCLSAVSSARSLVACSASCRLSSSSLARWSLPLRSYLRCCIAPDACLMEDCNSAAPSFPVRAGAGFLALL